jgi:hypothetical protein
VITQADTHLRGPIRVVVQVVWLALVGTMLVAFAAGVPVRLGQLLSVATDAAPGSIGQLFGLSSELVAVASSRLGPAEAGALHALGLSLGFYAGYILTFEVALALVCAVIGGFIFWRRSDDWMALWVSLLLVLLGTNGVSFVTLALATVWPVGLVLSTMAGLLGMVSLPHVLFLSPNGQFVPRWTLLTAAGCTGGILALGAYSFLENQGVWLFSSLLLVFPLWMGVMGLGVFSQIYRYMRVSDPVQRQQTKWMVVGLAAVFLGFAVNAIFLGAPGQQPGLPRLLFYLLARAPLVNLCMLLLPICVAFSIFRYRLWDIDLLIRRTLQYSVLSGLLALVYFGGVVLLQRIFTRLTGQGQNQLVTVLSTLAIAALFILLRRRVQDVIDRRFYRKKYDAAKVIAEFGATCRDETDLDKLTARLVEVVQETMQPEHVSLWLKPTEDYSARQKTVSARDSPRSRSPERSEGE